MPNDEPTGPGAPDDRAGGGRPTVGVIGLGAIGDGVATSLQREGFPLVVCDVRTEATDAYADAALVADSPADLVRRSDVVVVAVGVCSLSASPSQSRNIVRVPSSACVLTITPVTNGERGCVEVNQLLVSRSMSGTGWGRKP